MHIWDVATGAEIATLPGHSGWVMSLEYSPDGRYLASAAGTMDLVVAVWDVEQKRLRHALQHTKEVHDLAWTRDGKNLVTASEEVAVWNMDNGGRLGEIAVDPRGAGKRKLRFSPDGKLLAIDGAGELVHLYDAGGWTEAAKLPGSTLIGWHHADGSLVVHRGGEVAHVEPRTGKRRSAWKAADPGVRQAELAIDGRLGAAARSMCGPAWIDLGAGPRRRSITRSIPSKPAVAITGAFGLHATCSSSVSLPSAAPTWVQKALAMVRTRAPVAASYQAALKQIYVSMVPPEQAVDLRVDFGVLARKPGEQAFTAVAADAPIATGTQVYFSLRTTAQAHIYLYQETAAGKINVMFPHPKMPMANPLPAGQELRIPPAPGYFTLEAEGVGPEQRHIERPREPERVLDRRRRQPRRVPAGQRAQLGATAQQQRGQGLLRRPLLWPRQRRQALAHRHPILRAHRQRSEPREAIEAGQRQSVDAAGQRERVAGRDQVEAADPHRPLPLPGRIMQLRQAGAQRARLGDQRPRPVPGRVRAQHPEPQRRPGPGLREQRLGVAEAGARR